MQVSPAAYSVEAFCQAYGIRKNLAYDEMKSGRLGYRKAGRRTIIPKADADSWLENLPKGRLDETTGE
jgi:hypothetical protein